MVINNLDWGPHGKERVLCFVEGVVIPNPRTPRTSCTKGLWLWNSFQMNFLLEFRGKWVADKRIRVVSVLHKNKKLITELIHLLCIRCKVIQAFWLSFCSELSTFKCQKWSWQLLSAIWSLGSEIIFWSHGPNLADQCTKSLANQTSKLD